MSSDAPCRNVSLDCTIGYFIHRKILPPRGPDDFANSYQAFAGLLIPFLDGDVTLPPIESKSAVSWLQSKPLGAF
jgi:hypothetical protein